MCGGWPFCRKSTRRFRASSGLPNLMFTMGGLPWVRFTILRCTRPRLFHVLFLLPWLFIFNTIQICLSLLAYLLIVICSPLIRQLLADSHKNLRFSKKSEILKNICEFFWDLKYFCEYHIFLFSQIFLTLQYF